MSGAVTDSVWPESDERDLAEACFNPLMSGAVTDSLTILINMNK